MSKGNLLLGYARGAVGDVVFSRLDGQQITRARNRAPRNPKTNPQLVQRAFMATILQAYKAGKAIFDHSFEGKSVGAGCMREFMSLNLRKLRSQVAAEIEAGTSSADCKARVVGPGTISPVPNEYIVSTGTYDQTLFDADGKMPAPGTGIDTFAKYCEQVGLIDGDYYTIVAFAPNTNEEEVFAISGERDYGARQFPGVFAFVRLTVKPGLTTSTEALPPNISFNSLFQVDASANFSGDLLAEGITTGISTVDIFGDLDDMAFGIIRSRKDQDLRSNTTLKLAASNPMGITSNFALLAWQQGSVQVGDSSLILEGGNF